MNLLKRNANRIPALALTLLLILAFALCDPDKTMAQVSGSGTTGKIPKWTSPNTIGDSVITESSGKIGIGLSSPAYKFDLSSMGGAQFHITSTGADTGLYLFANGDDAWYLGGAAFDGSQWIAKSNTAAALSQALGTFVFYSNSGLTVGHNFTPAERMRLTPLGRLGIGNANPLTRLHVGNGTLAPITGNPSLLVQDGDATSLVVMGNSGGEMFLYQNNIGGVMGTASNHYLDIRTNNTSRARITANGNIGIGTVTPDATVLLHVAGAVRVDGNIAAKYQDVAEWVPTDREMAAGTVVTLDAKRSNFVIPASSAYDTKVAGVVSEKPGVILGEAGAGKAMIATTGRVRVKVDATRGPIEVGDLLVTSEKEGIAMKSEPIDVGGAKIHRPGTIIGKALEPLARGKGEILVLLSLQ